MEKRITGGHWLEIGLFTLSALVLYFTGVGIFVFLVPLQVVATRRGTRGMLAATGLFTVVFLGFRLWGLISAGAALDVLSVMEIGIVVSLLLGLVAINVPLRGAPRTLFRVLAVTGIAGLLAIPAALLLKADAGFETAMNGMFAEISRTMASVFTTDGDGVASSLMASFLEPSRLRQFAEAYLLRSLLVDYAVLLSFSWWAGQAAARAALRFGGEPPRFTFSAFRLEGWWLWVFIGAAALVLADLFFGLSTWAYAVWNIALVVLFLYGLQGMAIIWFLFDTRRVPRFLWYLLIAGLMILAASPGVGELVILAIPLLGISENWIRLRVAREAAPSEED